MLLTTQEKIKIYDKVQWLIDHSHLDEERRFEIMEKLEKELMEEKRREKMLVEKDLRYNNDLS